MELSISEIIEKLENEEINWDNVYDIKIKDKENTHILETYIKKKNLSQHSKKIRINSIYGALDNKYFFLNSRDLSGSITFSGRSIIKLTADNFNKKLSKLFGDNDYVIAIDTDSNYISIKDIVKKIEKKLNKNFNEMSIEEKEKFIDIINKISKEQLQPVIEKTIGIIMKTFNSYKKGFVGAKQEKIFQSGIFVAKKKYALKTIWNEGTFYLKNPKISVTGLEVVRSSTPPFAIKKLKEALELLLENKDLIDFIEKTKKEFYEILKKNPEQIAKVSGINNLDYKKDKKGWYRIDENGKRIACPINSRAAILYNQYVIKHKIQDTYPLINEGDKIKFVKLKMPNPVGEDVIAFQDERFLFDTGLIDYIDAEMMFEDIIIQPLRNIIKVTGTPIEKKDNILDF